MSPLVFSLPAPPSPPLNLLFLCSLGYGSLPGTALLTLSPSIPERFYQHQGFSSPLRSADSLTKISYLFVCFQCFLSSTCHISSDKSTCFSSEDLPDLPLSLFSAYVIWWGWIWGGHVIRAFILLSSFQQLFQEWIGNQVQEFVPTICKPWICLNLQRCSLELLQPFCHHGERTSLRMKLLEKKQNGEIGEKWIPMHHLKLCIQPCF